MAGNTWKASELWLLCIGCVFTSVPVTTWAQDDPGDGRVVLDEIVLKGAKQEKSYTETTASVGYLDQQAIAKSGVADLREAYSLFGNVSYLEGGSGNSGFLVRGLSPEGVTETFNTAPLTSVIVDGTSQTIETMRRGARGLWDVDQAEIYRGPQSTLQGRGALAGAVVVQTKDPTFYPEADLRVILGNNDRREGAFAVSGPVIADVFAARISGEYRKRDRGIDYSLDSHEIYGEDEFRNLRGKFLFTPTDIPGLTVKLTYSDTFDRPGLAEANGEDFLDRRFTVGAVAFPEVREADNSSTVLEIGYDLGNGMEITSITSYLRANNKIYGLEGFAYQRDASWEDVNLTQDLRLNFGTEDSQLSGVVGLFFGRFTQPREDLMTNAGAIAQRIKSDDETTHASIYGEVDWRFATGWTLTAGGRLLTETVRDEQVYCGLLFGILCDVVPSQSVDGKTTDTVVLPKLALSYDLTPDQSLSFSIQRGYRSGLNAITDAAGPTRVKPEYLTSYELAYRAEDPAGLWRFGVSGFYSKYTDQQVVVPRTPPNLPRTENAGESTMYGAEIEGFYDFDNGINVFGSLGLLRTEFETFFIDGIDLSGNEFPGSPHVTAGLGVSYDRGQGVFGSIMANYTSSYYSLGGIARSSLLNDDAMKVGSFSQVDAQIGYRFEEPDAELILYVDNVFDNAYVKSLSGGPPPTQGTVSEPRSAGIEFRVRF